MAKVPKFGRYAIAADGPQGTAVQVVQRMTGPGATNGVPGFEDGRVDVFLDVGDVQVVALSDAKGSGKAALSMRRFVETSTSPEELPELRVADGTLHDYEQRTWWIRVADRRPVAIEASGRALADLRLWQDGSWLVDAEPLCLRVTPARGRDETSCTLTTSLEPGWYAVTAYGGPERAWAERTDESPLHARWGLPGLPTAGREGHVMSAFGVDRYVVPSGPTQFSLELPARTNASIAVDPYDATRPFGGGSPDGTITDESRVPQVVVSDGGGSRVLTVRAAPGQRYTLTWFTPFSGHAELGYGKDVFVSTLSAGTPEDRPDASGFIVPNPDDEESLLGSQRARVPTAVDTVWVRPGEPYRRRFTATRAVTLWVSAEAGTYEVKATSTARAQPSIRVEPPLLSRGPRYEPPEAVRGGGRFDLTGFQTITVLPDGDGVVELTIASPRDRVESDSSPIAGVQFPEVARSNPWGTSLYAADVFVPTGLVMRELPVDLADALPVSLRPGGAVGVRVRLPAQGLVTATLEDGTSGEVSVDDGPFAVSVDTGPGEHTVKVRTTSDRTRTASLAWTPPERVDGPLPKVPPAVIAALPKFPKVGLDGPVATEFETGQLRTWSLTIPKAGLYDVTTTGLLATEGALRTRTITSLATASENGIGRNFDVARYLGAGDYQVSTRVLGQSAGHAQVVARAAVVHDGGTLSDGNPARITLPAGEGVLYTAVITEAGMYTLATVAPGRSTYARLEDESGWPLRAPDAEASFRGWLEPGRYRWMVLPDDDDAPRVTTLAREVEVARYEGHGPHALPLDTEVNGVWREPGPKAKRSPDVWTFDLTAPTTVYVDTGPDMTGAVFRGDEKVATVYVGRPLTLALAAGSYRLELANARHDHGAPYTVRVHATDLLPGQSRAASDGDQLAVSIGQTGDYEFESTGGSDVRAELYDDKGVRIAASDDRPDDWNFRVAARLAPGRYTLHVRGVGEDYAETTVHLRPVAWKDAGSLALATSVTVTGTAMYRITPGSSGVVLASAASTENVTVAIDADEGQGFVEVARADGMAPVAAASADRNALGWRVRIAPIDGRGQKVTARVDVESTARLGTGPSALAAVAKGVPAGAIGLREQQPGTFLVTDGTLACAPDCLPHEGVIAADTAVWLVGEPGARVSAARFVLSDASPAIPLARPATVDLAPHDGPVLVVARASAGTPALAFGDGPTGWEPATAIAVAPRGATTVQLSAAVSEPGASARLERFAYATPASGAIGYGTTDALVPANGAVAYAHPAGFADLRITLGRGLVAVLSDDKGAVTVLPALSEPATHVVPHGASRVLVLSTADTDVPCTIEVTRSTGSAPQVAARTAWEGLSNGEIVHLPLAGTGTLHVRGAALTTVDGRSQSGEVADLPVDRPGELVLHTGRGPVVAWLDGAGLFGGDDPSFAVSKGDALLLRVRAPTLAMTGDDVRVTDASVVFPVLAGGSTVRARGVAGGRSPARDDVVVLTAQPLGAGLGPPVLLGPGDARAFRFTSVGAGTTLGLGLAADADHVHAELFDAAGRRVATGVAMMPTLDAGDWLLVVQADDGALPVVVRPTLVGNDAPGNEPPPEVIESYRAGLPPSEGAD